MLFIHNSHTPQPPIQFLVPQTFRAFSEDSLYIKTFWIEGWGIEILTMIDVQKCQFLAKSENWTNAVSYTHLRAHETSLHLVCRLLLEKIQ